MSRSYRSVYIIFHLFNHYRFYHFLVMPRNEVAESSSPCWQSIKLKDMAFHSGKNIFWHDCLTLEVHQIQNHSAIFFFWNSSIFARSDLAWLLRVFVLENILEFNGYILNNFTNGSALLNNIEARNSQNQENLTMFCCWMWLVFCSIY